MRNTSLLLKTVRPATRAGFFVILKEEVTKMFNRHIVVSLVSIVGAIAIMTGGTMAYFTASADSNANTITTGTMELQVNQGADLFQPSTAITNLQPGETQFVRFDVQNTGTLPVNLRAAATGSWTSRPALDATKMEVTKVEFWNGSGWQQITANDNGLTGFVYYSPDGSSNSLLTLNGGATMQFRLTVQLDPTADTNYAGQTYTTTLHVQAKQTDPLATWPTTP